MGLGKLILDLIYPEPDRCQICDISLSFTEVPGLCYDCLSKINYLDYTQKESFCSICGRNIENVTESLGDNFQDRNFFENSRQYKTGICQQCVNNRPDYEFCRSLAMYDGSLREMLLTFKYMGEQELAKPLGYLLSIYYNTYFNNKKIDCLLPIPLHENRKRVRGFNQAQLLAEILGEKIGLPVISNLLVRGQDTPPLYDLDHKQRAGIMNDVFSINQGCNSKLADDDGFNTVLLIDDIITTGTTVNEASKVLKNESIFSKVYVYTLATATLE